MAGHQMGWCQACTVAMLCRAAPATLSPTHSSGRRIWFHNCSVHNAAPFPVHLDLDGTPARRYLPVLPWRQRQLTGPLRRIAVPCVVSSRTPRRYTRHAEPLACPATTAKNIGGLCRIVRLVSGSADLQNSRSEINSVAVGFDWIWLE